MNLQVFTKRLQALHIVLTMLYLCELCVKDCKFIVYDDHLSIKEPVRSVYRLQLDKSMLNQDLLTSSPMD